MIMYVTCNIKYSRENLAKGLCVCRSFTYMYMYKCHSFALVYMYITVYHMHGTFGGDFNLGCVNFSFNHQI